MRLSSAEPFTAARDMNVLLIDNYDSFTGNVAQQIAACGAAVRVVANDEWSLDRVRAFAPDAIVISPGPGTPAESGISCDVIRAYAGAVPMLGVCLGHQCMASVFAGPSSVVRAPVPVHGRTSTIYHDRKGIMRGVPSPFVAARYHSLIVATVPDAWNLMCWTGTQSSPDLVMGMRHVSLPIVGVQFHPESFLTEYGDRLMKNFLALA